jgi:hypothetical protein
VLQRKHLYVYRVRVRVRVRVRARDRARRRRAGAAGVTPAIRTQHTEGRYAIIEGIVAHSKHTYLYL